MLPSIKIAIWSSALLLSGFYAREFTQIPVNVMQPIDHRDILFQTSSFDTYEFDGCYPPPPAASLTYAYDRAGRSTPKHMYSF